MKTWKLVSGILSIVLSLIVLFQSCAVGLSNTLQKNGELGGSAGFIVTLMLISGGIVSIATRNSKKQGGNIALIVLYGLGALLGYSQMDNYGDLLVWATWCLICVILAIVAMGKQKKGKNPDSRENRNE